MTDSLTHDQIWTALDALGARYGLTPSGLARKAGLDPTTFNRSKRVTPEGRQRWPSTESIAKVLQATGASLDEFMALVSASRSARGRRLTRPLIGLQEAGGAGYFDEAGFATGGGWDEIDVLADADEHSYALEISGDAMTPIYRDGDIVIVSPAAAVRKGDRVVVKTAAGDILARELKRQTARTIELHSVNPAYPDLALGKDEVKWMARIIWASQ
jgi:phage repressor protein C with HTH and peptisase S24 domain